MRSRLPSGVVVVSGSLPPGLEPDRFGSFLAGLQPPLAVDASGPALVAALVDEETWLAEAPKVPQGNPVGSGDCLLGAYLLARADGASAEDALRLGVAAGAENVRNGGGGTLRGADVRAVAETVAVRRG